MDQLSLRQFEKCSQQIRFIDFINVPCFFSRYTLDKKGETLSLFHSGQELFDRFRISLESEIIFSDYCHDLIFPERDHIKFTTKVLMFTYPKTDFLDIHDDWLEVDSLDFDPWHNILMIQNIEGASIVEEFNQTQISDWLATIGDPNIDYPYVSARRGNIAVIFLGKPRSVRSKGGKASFIRQVESIRKVIEGIYPLPFKGQVRINIDIFLEDVNANDRPDIDRLSTLITDAFEGIAYLDDKQIIDLRPTIIDVSQAFTKLECRTHPMPGFSLSDIPIGSAFPLATGILNYYVVRLSYCNLMV